MFYTLHNDCQIWLKHYVKFDKIIMYVKFDIMFYILQICFTLHYIMILTTYSTVEFVQLSLFLKDLKVTWFGAQTREGDNLIGFVGFAPIK